MSTPGTLRHGTSSWSDSSWVGPFYPKGTKPGDFLTHYATRFGTVEADVTYYRVPSPSMVEGWKRKTPEGFRLSAKFPRSIVHAGEGPRPDPDELLVGRRALAERDAFLDSMSRMGSKCGPLVLQFPYFNKKAFASRGPFLERLDRFLGALPADFRYAVELRNRNWLDAELTALLESHRAALVLVDLAYMPHPAHLAEDLELLTTDFAYCRLIGDRKAVDSLTKTFDRIVIDQEERLGPWADLLRGLLQRVPEVYVYANNHYAGHGPATADEIARRVGD